MKKKLFLSIVCILFMASTGQPQESSVRRKVNANLEVSASIRERQMCMQDSAIRISLVVVVKFMNTGNYPIIIAKDSGEILYEHIAHTETDAYARKYEYDPRYEDFGSDIKFIRQGKTPDESFMILKPKETYERIGRMASSLYFSDSDKYRHYLETDHFIRFNVSTMPRIILYTNAPDDAIAVENGSATYNIKPVREHWIKYGYLWFDSPTSPPIRIQFQPAVNLKPC